MKTIEIEVPDNIKGDMPLTAMTDGNLFIVVFDLTKEQAETKPHKQAESIARFQKDVEEHGEAWAIDHWQVKSNSKWLNLHCLPTWNDNHQYRRVIKIGNRKVSEPVTKLELGQQYFYSVPYDNCICSDKYESDSYENQLLKSGLVRLTEEDSKELHEAILAVLAGE